MQMATICGFDQVGRVGSSAVASVGTAGFYAWLAMAFIHIPKIETEVVLPSQWKRTWMRPGSISGIVFR